MSPDEDEAELMNSCSKSENNNTRSRPIKVEKPSLEYEIYIEGDCPEEDKPTCQVCQKKFKDYCSRNQHLITAHDPVKAETQPSDYVIDVEEEYHKKKNASRQKNLKCQRRAPIQKMLSNYRRKTSLLRSTRKDPVVLAEKLPRSEHSIQLKSSASCLESNCTSSFPFVQDLRNHLVIDHNFEPLNEEKYQFSSLQEFEDWKSELEEKSKSRWFRHHTKTFQSYRLFIYDCFNMLEYRHQGSGEEQCTSQIIVKVFIGSTERFEVSYFKDHYGHGPLAFRKKPTSQSRKRKRKCTETSDDHSEDESGSNRCSVCQRSFASRQSLNRHVKKKHQKGTIPDTKSGPIECFEPDCGKKFGLRRFLRGHLIDEHNFKMHPGEVFKFSTLEEFQNWKSKIEEETQSFYKKRLQYKNKTYKKAIHYVCIRSGKLLETGNRKRHLKLQGSRRSNIHCTSEIKLKYLDEGFEAVYYRDHYGHDNALVHLPFPKKLKQEIAEKLMAGLSVKAILQEIRLSSGDQLYRKHLVRKKDIDNIKATYGIKTPRFTNRSENGVSDMDAWVKDIQTNFDGVILFYKPEGSCFEELEDADFIVVCMTQFQRKMAAKFGSDRICVDSTFDEELSVESNSVCELTTILVVNDYEEAIPIAFCLSSKINLTILRLFFCSVRDVMGLVDCYTFVAVEDPLFHSAWCQIMSNPPYHVMCAWHLDAAWKSKLGKIMNKNKRLWIYERLKACQLQCDINEFTEMFNSFLDELQLYEDTKEFYHYINKYYASRPEMWANAHRIGIKINTNLYLDNFHRNIRRNFMLGRGKRCIEKCISAINDYILNREYEQLIEYCRGKVCTKMNAIASRHEDGILILPAVSAIIDSVCWVVPSPPQDLIYVVNRVENHNCDSSCAIFCEKCKACLKGYTCSCDDNAIKGNVCAHLHAVAEYQKCPGNAIQYIVIEGNDDLLIGQGEVMIDQSDVKTDNEGSRTEENCVLVVDRDDQIIDNNGRVNDNDDQVIDNDGQGIENYDQLIDDDDQVVNKDNIKADYDDEVIENNYQMIYNEDRIIDSVDDEIIHSEGHIIDCDDDDQIINAYDDQIIDAYDDDDQIIVGYDCDQIIDNDEQIIDNDEQIIVTEHAENPECSELVTTESKDDLVSTALQLMGDLADLEDVVPENVSDQVRKHIEMARKLLRKSLAASKSKA